MSLVQENGVFKEILERIERDNVKFIQLQFTDLHGMIKSVTILKENVIESLTKGTWFDGSSVEGFTRISESDMYLKPDPNTYAVLPWASPTGVTARFICDVYTPNGNPFEGDPRYILKKVLREAEELGLEFNVGPELEFFLFKRSESGKVVPKAHDAVGYFDFSPGDLAKEVRKEIVLALEFLGIDIEALHHEVAPSQHEINFKYGPALLTADRALTFKYVVKTIAHKHGLHATFMPKPMFGENGSGMHVNQSLFDKQTKRNLFFDLDGEYKLSKIAQHFVAGQLAHAKGFCAVVAPTVNSYKRLVPGYEAPVYISWAGFNRSALIRIPRYSPGREKSTRIELRCPDPSSNPYLAFAVMLKAGLDGIKRKLEPPRPIEEDLFKLSSSERERRGIATLPGSLGEAINELKKDSVVKEALGSHAFSLYLKAKQLEWDSYQMQVTPWEIEMYLKRM